MTDDAPRSALEASSLAVDIDFLTVKMAADATRLANRRLSEHDLRVRSFAILALAAGELPVTQRDLASFLSLDPSQIVALVDELERADLVRREVDSADRRSRVICLTPQGTARLALGRQAVDAVEDDLLSPLTTDERATLRELLRKVVFGRDLGED